MGVRIVGIGQRFAGDDGVGIEVLRHLGDMVLPSDVTLHEVVEPTQIIDLVQTAERVIVLDALLGPGAPGDVRCVAAGELDSEALASVSTHGLGIGQAIALARILEPAGVSPAIVIVGVTIRRPRRQAEGLSPAVARAVPRAVAAVLSQVRGAEVSDA